MKQKSVVHYKMVNFMVCDLYLHGFKNRKTSCGNSIAFLPHSPPPVILAPAITGLVRPPLPHIHAPLSEAAAQRGWRKALGTEGEFRPPTACRPLCIHLRSQDLLSFGRPDCLRLGEGCVKNDTVGAHRLCDQTGRFPTWAPLLSYYFGQFI